MIPIDLSFFEDGLFTTDFQIKEKEALALLPGLLATASFPSIFLMARRKEALFIRRESQP